MATSPARHGYFDGISPRTAPSKTCRHRGSRLDPVAYKPKRPDGPAMFPPFNEDMFFRASHYRRGGPEDLIPTLRFRQHHPNPPPTGVPGRLPTFNPVPLSAGTLTPDPAQLCRAGTAETTPDNVDQGPTSPCHVTAERTEAPLPPPPYRRHATSRSRVTAVAGNPDSLRYNVTRTRDSFRSAPAITDVLGD